MKYDPYNNQQLRFERKDPTGRWERLHIKEEENIPIWVYFLGVVWITFVLFLILGE